TENTFPQRSRETHGGARTNFGERCCRQENTGSGDRALSCRVGGIELRTSRRDELPKKRMGELKHERSGRKRAHPVAAEFHSHGVGPDRYAAFRKPRNAAGLA